MSLLSRISTEEVTVQANEIRVGQMLLRLIAGFFYLLGFVLGRTLSLVFYAIKWCAIAVKLGWRDGVNWQKKDTGSG